jgi:hypothetical protein
MFARIQDVVRPAFLIARIRSRLAAFPLKAAALDNLMPTEKAPPPSGKI